MTSLIVHIGDGKTGSSSIQRSLYEARKSLSDCGIIYDPPVVSGGHFDYVRLIGAKLRGGGEDSIARVRRSLDRLQNIISSGKPEYVLLSAESFFRLKPAQISSLLGLLPFEFDGLHVLGYIRRPESLYLSRVQQSLKADHRFTHPARFRNDVVSPFRNWGGIKQCKSVTARLFDRETLVNGSVVDDFCEYLQSLSGQRDFSLPAIEKNTSLSAEQVIVMQEFRREYCFDVPGQYVRSSTNLLKCFHALNDTFGIVGTPLSLKDEFKAVVRGNNAEFMVEIANVFSDLAVLMEYSDFLNRDVCEPEGKLCKVSSLFVDYSSEVVDFFRSLVAESGSLEDSEVSAAFAKIVGGSSSGAEEFSRIYKSYLSVPS